MRSGARKGAILYASIRTTKREYCVGDDCFVEAEDGALPYIGVCVP